MKKIIIISMLAIIGLSVCMPVGKVKAQSLTDSLLLYYKFNSNALDSSGNGYDGTVYGATLTTDRFGNANSAYSFDGACATDAYIDLPNESRLKPQLPFSFSLWVYFYNLEHTQLFTTDYYVPEYTGCWISLTNGPSPGDTVVGIVYGDGGAAGLASSRRCKIGMTNIIRNQWYHIIGVFRGPTDMDIYINCRNDSGTYNGTGGNIAYSSSPGSIGRKNTSTSLTPIGYFNGKLDEIMFWNRALTPTDVEYLCKNTGINEMCNSLNTSVYPNPATDYLIIENPQEEVGSGSKQDAVIEIANIQGQLIKTLTVKGKINIDVSALPRGVYILNVKTENGISVKKFVKE